MIIAIIIIGGTGLFVGIFLSIGGIAFKIKTDEREEAILEALPGNNCGGCGYPGCSGLAAAIAKNEAKTNACPIGGDTTAQKIAKIMGVEALNVVPRTAFVRCNGTNKLAAEDYEYFGQADCKMLSAMPNGGHKACNYGCLGLGNCKRACPFDAIDIKDGVAKVDKNRCMACGRCVLECPKHIIELIPKTAQTMVACSSKDKGIMAMKGCELSCIGCFLCKKNCPNDAIIEEGFLAHIDYEKCVNCGVCVTICPKKCIIKNLK